jgi:hypothetical protein
MSRAPCRRRVRKRFRALSARAACLDPLTDTKSEQIADLQTGDRSYSDERHCSCRLATCDSDPNGNGDRKQDGWSQDKNSETLSERSPDQKHENGK